LGKQGKIEEHRKAFVQKKPPGNGKKDGGPARKWGTLEMGGHKVFFNGKRLEAEQRRK